MTSTRPYRRGLTQEEVRVEIEKWSGQQFDPEIAVLLLNSRSWSTLMEPVESDSSRCEIRIVTGSVGPSNARALATGA
jgi:HD-GYP domain-containing protein (c-di-GMP phosphodiesterase class II)